MRRLALIVVLSTLSAFCPPSSFLRSQVVTVGAQILLRDSLGLLDGKSVGLVCNQTSVLPGGTRLLDTLLTRGIHVTAVFSPEHGLAGARPAGESQDNSVDLRTAVRVYSLYGKSRKPLPEMLTMVDVLVFDMQDVGARFYTYVSTMAYAMESAAENKKPFVVLDRPNPINGVAIEGPVLDTTLKSFVGMFPIPIRHAMTVGELARMIAGERWIHEASTLELTVIPMQGWRRSMWYDDTGLLWVSPSPNMRTLDAAAVYPGMCIFERTNISEGRGTAHPFETIGAPWIDRNVLAEEIRKRRLPGVDFAPIRFIPSPDSGAAPRPKFAGTECEGVEIHVSDRVRFRPVNTALNLLSAIHKLYPNKLDVSKDIDGLVGTSELRQRLGTDSFDPHSLLRNDSKMRQFEKLRAKYLLYR